MVQSDTDLRRGAAQGFPAPRALKHLKLERLEATADVMRFVPGTSRSTKTRSYAPTQDSHRGANASERRE